MNETGPVAKAPREAQCKQARPHEELVAEILDPRRLKTEREHAAAKEIDKLRQLLRAEGAHLENVKAAWQAKVDVNVRRFGAPGKKDEWLTPPGILNRLGEFDLDPCTPIDRPWDTAKRHYNVVDDGLKQEWFGRVWLNPPFGPRIFEWVEKLAQHGDGIALIPARTETKGFHSHVWGVADGVFFFKGRQAFHNGDGSVANGSFGAPCCLICYGKHNVRAVLTSGIDGVMVFDA